MYNYLKLLLVILLGYTVNVTAQSVAPTITFSYSGGMQTYTVPIGITQLYVVAKGGCGGLNSSEAGHPDRFGYGGCIYDTLVVVPGQVINLFVGGKGTDAVTGARAAGGYNGGGNGNFGGPFNLSGGGGGGASDIRVGGTALSNRAIVAGGGGGAAPYCAVPGTPDIDRGGDGGGSGLGSTTANFAGEAGHACSGTTGGGGGTYTTYGTGGYCSTCAGNPGFRGDSVALGTGGSAGDFSISAGYASAGGGGGGGWHGGGGGNFNKYTWM